MKQAILLLTAVSALCCVSAVSAKTMDLNDDGAITRFEYNTANDEIFKEQDVNFDGRISKDEITAYYNKAGEKASLERYKKFDADGDGRVYEDDYQEVTLKEAKKKYETAIKRGEARFDKLDLDGNGHISKSEYETGTIKAAETRMERSIKSGKRSFKRRDKDGDGILTPEEFSNRTRQTKSSTQDDAAKPLMLDGDEDGVITRQEYDAFKKHKFGQLDKDKNDELSKGEAKFYFSNFSKFAAFTR